MCPDLLNNLLHNVHFYHFVECVLIRLVILSEGVCNIALLGVEVATAMLDEVTVHIEMMVCVFML